ncbi:MAG: hypothetical protein IPM55_04975 [Acidobacteria bacterium]|nr:hypothetical protein [Acidobacteriota bacterium]
MNKEMTILIIAQNGLKTAAMLFTSKAMKLDKQLQKITDKTDKKEVASLKKRLGKAKKLASILTAADEGIVAYMRESDDEE